MRSYNCLNKIKLFNKTFFNIIILFLENDIFILPNWIFWAVSLSLRCLNVVVHLEFKTKFITIFDLCISFCAVEKKGKVDCDDLKLKTLKIPFLYDFNRVPSSLRRVLVFFCPCTKMKYFIIINNY